MNNAIFAPMKKSMKETRKVAKDMDNRGIFNGYGAVPNNIVIDHILIKNCKALIFKTLVGNYRKPFISDHYPEKTVSEIH
jgi:hypothetical protein